MKGRLRFLLDTNVVIPLQDPQQVLADSLANFVRLAGAGGHQLLCHPANVRDFQRDPDVDRRKRNLHRLRQFEQLEDSGSCPWNGVATSANDACDNELLYALQCDAVHALVTEDRRLYRKAQSRGLTARVYTIQTAEDWLRRLHEPRLVALPNIQDVPLYTLTPELSSPFFDSLRAGYPASSGKPGFDDWFRAKAREKRRAWVYRGDDGALAALCIYQAQSNEVINDAGDVLSGAALKLCTFKVGELVRGRKIGELFLKAAFRYATDNQCLNIFITAKADSQDFLVQLLQDFGFEGRGAYGSDMVLVKCHPAAAPSIGSEAPVEFLIRYFPHFRADVAVKKWVVPILPGYHEILFPDYPKSQTQLFGPDGHVGNAIKLAYLCHARTKSIRPGDVVLFYRSADEKAVTSVGVVERFEILQDAASIAGLVRRRTVYSIKEIERLTSQPTKVILFRLIGHVPRPVTYDQLLSAGVVTGPIQSITQLSDDSFSSICSRSGLPPSTPVNQA
ncbi:N-acetyltransferase [Pelomonas sp. V22]|uniref:N-acetyltransferase n=1 Tax=Pelomonas sp. V22 TaxID=2822139 RepID=UPI0024A860FC|nr:N-acetyltransferase [Pelomonas sp. V22]MDI4633140.1 N-acetyltransferase [Pelomonas sp. V22]